VIEIALKAIPFNVPFFWGGEGRPGMGYFPKKKSSIFNWAFAKH
jgi:hypothetical protein